MNSNIKLIAAALVVGVTFYGTLALAQTKAPLRAKTTAKTDTGDPQARAKAAIAPTLMKYTYRYKPAADQKAKLEKVLLAQYRQLDKDRDAVRKAMYRYSTSDYYRKLRKEVSEKILTEEQRKATSPRKSSRR